GLQPPQRLVDLPRRALLVAAVDLGHEKRLVAIAVAQRLSHADLARPTVVVPAVVEEVDTVVDGGADDTDGFLLVRLPPEMVAAHTDQRHHFSSAPQAPVGNPVADVARDHRVYGAGVSSSAGVLADALTWKRNHIPAAPSPRTP